jgi:hypothetical protein
MVPIDLRVKYYRGKTEIGKTTEFPAYILQRNAFVSGTQVNSNLFTCAE